MRKIILHKKNRAQVGVEYMMIIGFVTFAIMTVLALAIFYSDKTKDKIKLNYVDNFATQLINSAESVFFSGEPSKTTLDLYLPDGVTSIQILCSDGSVPSYGPPLVLCNTGLKYLIVITTHTSSGDNVQNYESKVPIVGASTPPISVGEGVRTLTLEAKSTYLLITN
jgi:hypothetical protein